MIIGIVAVAKNLAIGKDGKLPWHYSSDLKFFKETTFGNAVVMGINTWHAIGRPLPGRLNIVLSRTATVDPRPDVLLMRGSDEVLSLGKYLKGDIYVIGGARTYESFAGAIDRWIVTEIPETVPDADAFMPVGFLDGFDAAESRTLDGGLVVKYFQRSSAIAV